MYIQELLHSTFIFFPETALAYFGPHPHFFPLCPLRISNKIAPYCHCFQIIWPSDRAEFWTGSRRETHRGWILPTCALFTIWTTGDWKNSDNGGGHETGRPWPFFPFLAKGMSRMTVCIIFKCILDIRTYWIYNLCGSRSRYGSMLGIWFL